HFVFFFKLPTPPVINTLSLHDALPISTDGSDPPHPYRGQHRSQTVLGGQSVAAVDLHGLIDGAHGDLGSGVLGHVGGLARRTVRSEEHTSELQSRENLVCRLLLEKKKK